MNIDHIFPYHGYQVRLIKTSEDFEKPMRIYLERLDTKPCLCYRCGTPMTQVRSFGRQVVEDLPVMGRKTFVHFRRRKCRCPHCKKTRYENVEFLSNCAKKITKRYAFFINKLSEFAPVTRIAEAVQIPPTSLWRHDLEILESKFKKYEIPSLSHICVDEVYAKSWHDKDNDENRDDRFFTIISDLVSRKVVWVEYSRRKAALDRFFKKIGPEACSKIRVVASDEHDDYRLSIEEHCKNATHVLDRFHLVKNFEEAVNETRKRLFKMLPQPEVKKLAAGRFRFIFLKADHRRNAKEKSHMAQVMKDNEAFINLEIIKEKFLTFFAQEDIWDAAEVLDDMGTLISEAGFPELKDWWRKIVKKWDLVKNYFDSRVSSSLSEGINNVVKVIKRRAFGFKNLEYFRLKIMQVTGPLSSDLTTLDGEWTKAGRRLFGIDEIIGVATGLV